MGSHGMQDEGVPEPDGQLGPEVGREGGWRRSKRRRRVMTKMGSSVSTPRMGSFILGCLTHKVGQGERGFHSFVWSGATTPACAGPPAEVASRVGCTTQNTVTELPKPREDPLWPPTHLPVEPAPLERSFLTCNLFAFSICSTHEV